MQGLEHLSPVSFHLRNFNKYRTLDMPAAANGNLTLIGENAAGKTTLANCFFPMLIDGSIATPSFNPAKGTDRVDRTTGPRNSARDMRTFNSMLLGWGPGAMKVRTGYSYLLLRSTQRQVILGIGAHRNVSEKRQPTWWFVVTTTAVTTPLTLVTTDEAGASLDYSDFVVANEELGDRIHIFKSVEEYHQFVATQIYGFTNGRELTKLASVYRLLASPILTAGNARFTPIREALKNAQEGIDSQIINAVASAQREVNRTNGSLQRIHRAQERLQKMKKEIFWRNLNLIDERMLRSYSQTQHDYKDNQEKCLQAKQRIEKLDQQLVLLQNSLAENAQTLERLRQEKTNQASIAEQRQDCEERLANLKWRLQQYRAQRQHLDDLEDQATAVAKQLAKLKAEKTALRNQQLRPLLTDLATRAKGLTELTAVVTEVDPETVATKLKAYLREQQQACRAYQADERAKQNVSQDVKIVVEMQYQLAERIDQHASGALQSRVRKDLHQDNREIHEAGAAKMNVEVQRLAAHQQSLLAAHSDLKANLADPTKLTDLQDQRHRLTDILTQIATIQRDSQQQVEKQADLIGQIQYVQENMEADFDEDRVTTEMAEVQQRHDALKLDPDIDDKLNTAEADRQRLANQQQEFGSQKSQAEGEIKTTATFMDRQHQTLVALQQQIERNLQTLAPYQPADCQLTTADEVLAFVQQHASTVRNNRVEDLSNQIGKQIHRNNQDGVDRNALDTVFEERGYTAEASAMRQQHAIKKNDLIVVAFDINRAIVLMKTDEAHVEQALTVLKSGNDAAQKYYLTSAVSTITTQYDLIDSYNQMLSEGVSREQSIKLRVALTPASVTGKVIEEARNAQLTDRPALEAEVENRLNKLAKDLTVADDDDAFMQKAQEMLDTRQWSDFKVLIKRRQSDENHYEEVDDKFVQSGGSGAEKAQAMVLLLLLVPKMVLRQAKQTDAPYLVMFDEFADKLDPETAKSFAKTIARFGFNFIATMPGGAQNKILADGVSNIAYEVIAPKLENDRQFHLNRVRSALIWGEPHESVS
ncbi:MULTISPECIES: SbcC/MukB-like Walker B domain-containing protein [unclassified Levilactobacillus]|uniref:SbcC/MukB-like Walker B domain-containing protein n=1 Tax=unclassified Levilactobacillus TaxID=2767918 RepID=UPI002FF3783A